MLILAILVGHMTYKFPAVIKSHTRYYSCLFLWVGVIGMIVAECMYADFRIPSPSTSDFIRFEPLRNLQGMILLMGGFIWNKEILDLYNSMVVDESDDILAKYSSLTSV